MIRLLRSYGAAYQTWVRWLSFDTKKHLSRNQQGQGNNATKLLTISFPSSFSPIYSLPPSSSFILRPSIWSSNPKTVARCRPPHSPPQQRTALICWRIRGRPTGSQQGHHREPPKGERQPRTHTHRPRHTHRKQHYVFMYCRCAGHSSADARRHLHEEMQLNKLTLTL